MADNKYDVIVIGAGPGGYHAAIRAAQLEMKVCLIEKDDGTGNGGIGGVCLNWGCIPSKSLLKNAELLNEMKNPDEWGFSFKEFKADISKAIDRSREVSKKLTQGIEFLVKKNYLIAKLDDAIVEFNKVKYLLDYDGRQSLESIQLLAQAHFNLGITYAKMELYNQAEQEILNAISLIPNKEYRDVLNMVRNKIRPSESSAAAAP